MNNVSGGEKRVNGKKFALSIKSFQKKNNTNDITCNFFLNNITTLRVNKKNCATTPQRIPEHASVVWSILSGHI